MKLRKLLALALALALTLGVGGSALAEGAPADQDLMNVTAKVKAALGMETEEFDDFQGWADESVLLGRRWHLEWTGDGVGLSITADDDGKIYSYYRSESASDEPVADKAFATTRLQLPSLPQDKSKECRAAAEDFMAKVLTAGLETVELDGSSKPSLYANSYRYSGVILLNGKESPIDCSITVRSADAKVMRFWRNDESAGYLGGVPAADTAVTQAQAQRLLQSTLDLQPFYVLDDESKVAKVMYLPQRVDEFYVDGATGELVNLTELRAKLWRGDATNGIYDTSMKLEASAEAPADAGDGLTQAEKDGAAILADALTKEDLDKTIQNAWPEIGLAKYTLASATYSIFEKELEAGAERTADDYDVTCRLVYAQKNGEDIARKYVTVDAKTGELKSLWSHRPYDKETTRFSTSAKTGQTAADAILKTFAGDNAPQVELYETVDGKETLSTQHTYTYYQKANGFFYPGNSYTVSVDGTDGTISGLSGSFDEEVVLQAPAKVVSRAEAIAAYATAMVKSYRYVEVPVSVDLAGEALRPLLKEAGYNYVNTLKPGYVLAQPEEGYIRGVDAETGSVVTHTDTYEDQWAITYDDLDGHWVQPAAQALAVFDIGLPGGSLKPQEGLTQLDMVVLLSSVDGYRFDPQESDQDALDALDALYDHAYYLGLVTPETRDEDKAVTRGELVKLILDAAGYERIAAIPGIFRCDYADVASIDAAHMGYAALAQGLGLVKGGSDGTYAAGRAATRAEAIAMLYQYMK